MRKFIATVLILNGLIWFGLSNIAKADTKTEAIIGHVIHKQFKEMKWIMLRFLQMS